MNGLREQTVTGKQGILAVAGVASSTLFELSSLRSRTPKGFYPIAQGKLARSAAPPWVRMR